MKAEWKIIRTEPAAQKVLAEGLGASPVLAQLLVNRGIRDVSTAREFLFGDLSSCHDPSLMKDMDKAVERVRRAVSEGEKILIYGDYDVDGVTSTAMIAEVLGEIGARVETFIPNRIADGYGLNLEAITKATESGTDLLITVDCGINSNEEVALAAKNGIDVIITDHHVVRGEERPAAYAVVDPHQEDCGYPFKYLAGVGVAYKFCKALLGDGSSLADEHLDLVALGTVSDVVPLIGENRTLVRNGLKSLRKTSKPGIRALMDIAKVYPEKMTCRHIGFALGPRINAIGRMGSAEIALELLMCREVVRSKEIAQRLDDENRTRQSIERDILKNAVSKVKTELDLDKENVIVLADQEWHPGVIGIVASRLTEQFSKPAILIALEEGKGKGSGRGVEGFNLFEAIDKAGEHLIDFGGHRSACGIRIEEDKISMFRESLNEVALSCVETEEPLIPELNIDMQIPFSFIGVKLIDELNRLMPFGAENPEPVLCTKDIKVKTSPRGIGRNGLKFLVTYGGMTCEAVTFNKNRIERPKAGDMLDLAYVPSINSWRGIETIQLNIKDLRIQGRD